MFSDIRNPTMKKGDAVKLSLNGTDFDGIIIETTIIKFIREYHLEFDDGSRRWFRDAVFQCMKN